MSVNNIRYVLRWRHLRGVGCLGLCLLLLSYGYADPEHHVEGIASWYGPRFAGKPTASGEIFNPEALTAAHRTLPFGTLVKVTNLRTDLSITVRINDRGPYSQNRVIDLSKNAAKKLDMLRSGLAPVQLEILHDALEDTKPDIEEAALVHNDTVMSDEGVTILDTADASSVLAQANPTSTQDTRGAEAVQVEGTYAPIDDSQPCNLFFDPGLTGFDVIAPAYDINTLMLVQSPRHPDPLLVRVIGQILPEMVPASTNLLASPTLYELLGESGHLYTDPVEEQN